LNQSTAVTGPGGRDVGKELFEKGNQQYDAGEYARALMFFDEAIENGVESEVLYNNKGAALDALGRNREAVDAYDRATSINPSYGLAWHNLGNSLYIQGLYSAAARAYSRGAELKPDMKENWSGLAASYTKLDETKKAEKAIDRLAEFAHQDPTVLLLQADLFTEAALLEKAVDCCNEFIALNPSSADGYEHLGNAEHEMGTYGKAMVSFEKALKLAPNDKEIWNNLGYTCFVAGNLERAIECFDRAIAIDRNYKHAWYNKGYAYHGADMLEKAVECYTEAIRIDSADRVLWNNLGNALYNLGRYLESIPKFVEAIGVDPDYEIAWNNIGNALEKMSEYRQAIPYHDRSLEISPDFDYALYAKGVCMSYTGNLEGAYDLVRESLDLNPTYDEAWKARARIARQLGRLDDALLSIEQSLALNPEFDEGWSLRGEILMASGNQESAQASFLMALKCVESVRPDTVSGLTTITRRGEILARLGRFEEALANFEVVASSNKLHALCIPRVLELRRFLNRWELPRSVRLASEEAPDPKVRLEYVRFLLDAGYVDAAERVLDTLPKGNELAGHIALSHARALAMRGGVDRAMQILRETRTQDGGSELACAEGEILVAARQFEAALKVLRDAMAKRPYDYGCSVAYARALLKLGRHKEALDAADLSIGIDSSEWEPHVIKAGAYDALGRAEDAAREREEASARLSAVGLDPEQMVVGAPS
jgi:tetratricopeptide (TPR) repeat protein